MNQQAQEGIAQFLTALGIDIESDEMNKTPSRVAALYESLFSGVGQSTEAVWGDLFTSESKGLVAITGINYYSICEHHLMPFFGTVDIIYQPHEGRVAGISKFGDVISVLAHRPQLQERLTMQLAQAIEQDLGAEGVLVRMRGTHMCMLLKGELPQGTVVQTLECRGVLGEAGPLREEALAMLGGTIDAQTTQLSME